MPFDELAGLQACNYSAMGALTFTVWDICITMGDELQQIWRRPWTAVKMLYLILRYFSFGAQLVSAIVSMKLGAGLIMSYKGCQTLAVFQGVSSLLLMMGVQVVLILRVKALYHDSNFLRRSLAFLYFAEMASMAVILSIAMPEIQYGPSCVIVSFPLISAAYLLIPLLFETFLFALTMIKFYFALKDGWGHEPMIEQFMQDGIWAFLLPFVIMVINTCCMALLDSALSSVAYSWQIAIPGFAGYRLILNMSHLLRHSRDYQYAGRVVLDTVPSLYIDDNPPRDSHELSDMSLPVTPVLDRDTSSRA